MDTIIAKIDQLSNLARETAGAAFVIQHCKDSGLWKVTFNNIFMRGKDKPQPKEFEAAIDDAIEFILLKRQK